MKKNKNKNEIKLTDNHVMTWDRDQFLLRTRVSKKGDQIKGKDTLVKEDRYEVTYHPTIKQVCDQISMDETKRGLNDLLPAFGIIEEIGDEFDAMIKGFSIEGNKAHFIRMELATIWFHQFLIKEDEEIEEGNYRRRARMYTNDDSVKINRVKK